MTALDQRSSSSRPAGCVSEVGRAAYQRAMGDRGVTAAVEDSDCPFFVRPSAPDSPHVIDMRTSSGRGARCMMSPRELLQRLAMGQLRNVRFTELHRLLVALGFELDRVRGSHHVYRHRAVHERVNIQPQGGQAKPYQLRQVVELVERYDLKLEDDQ